MWRQKLVAFCTFVLFVWNWQIKISYASLNEKLSIEDSSLMDEFPFHHHAKSYVFLQKFPLEGTYGLLFHTEVLVCPRTNFDHDDQHYLNDLLGNLTDFVEIEKDWWTEKSIKCNEFGYAGSSCIDRCCAISPAKAEEEYLLNDQRAVIDNVVGEDKMLYLYGKSKHLDGKATYAALCDQHCWSDWSGTDYNPLNNNCNTFTSAVLRCVFGLSEKKPNLGISDIVNVTCDPAQCVSDSSVLAIK